MRSLIRRLLAAAHRQSRGRSQVVLPGLGPGHGWMVLGALDRRRLDLN